MEREALAEQDVTGIVHHVHACKRIARLLFSPGDTHVTVDEVKAFLRANDARYLLAQFVDLHGAPKAKAVPTEHTDMVFGDGAGFAGFALWGMGMGPNGPDYMAIGDLDTLKPLPWMPGYARIVCNGHVHGKPYAYCSRVALKRQLDALASDGLTLYTGIEPEFMLLSRGADGSLAPSDPTDQLDKPCYDYKGLSRAGAFLDRMVDALRATGVDVYQIDHEDANGQFEVNFTYADALTSADNFVLVKMAASEIARASGMVASFMPKPFSNRTGSGAHFHLSIGNATTKSSTRSPVPGISLAHWSSKEPSTRLKSCRPSAPCSPSTSPYPTSSRAGATNWPPTPPRTLTSSSESVPPTPGRSGPSESGTGCCTSPTASPTIRRSWSRQPRPRQTVTGRRPSSPVTSTHGASSRACSTRSGPPSTCTCADRHPSPETPAVSATSAARSENCCG